MVGLRLFRAGAVAWLAACGGSPDATPDKSAAGTEAGACSVLTAEAVQEVTGVAVSRIERNPAIGAGGNCDNFTTPDGQPYLGVNRLDSKWQYTSAVESVPEDLYPSRSPVAGLGDDAVLMSGPGGLRYLAARKGEAGVVLFPLGQGFQMTDDQLRELASRALAAAG